MYSVVHDDRPGGEPDRNLELFIEKGFLLLGSIEFQIEEHLLSHGTRIGPETRLFMAQVRDAAGDAAAKMLDEARSRLDQTAPGEGAPEPADSDAGEASPGARLLPIAGTRLLRPGRRHGFALGRAAGHLAFGTASAALIAGLLVAGQAPSGAPTELSGNPNAVHAASDPGSAGAAGATTLRKPPHAEALSALTLPPRQSIDHPPYPDPRAGPAESPAGSDEREQLAAAGAGTSMLAEGPPKVQQQLALARFDPHQLNGILSPATRAAPGQSQSTAGVPETGYLDGEALTFLRDGSAGTYPAREGTKKARARQQANRTVLMSPVPRVSPLRADKCSRTRAGKIVYGRGVRCDFRGLRQSIARLFG